MSISCLPFSEGYLSMLQRDWDGTQILFRIDFMVQRQYYNVSSHFLGTEA